MSARVSKVGTLGAATAVAVSLGLASASPVAADTPPYPLPASFPAAASSPAWDPAAPFTPTVLNLIHQLEPDNPPTLAELTNAATLMHGTNSTICTAVGSNAAPTGTTPAIAPLCWADALGVNVTGGAQVRQTTASPLRLMMSSSFDTSLMNAWGQVEGSEGRYLGITGLYGPQVDITRIPNWGRDDTNLGEDPFLDGTMATSEINGVQGKGLMDQMKHFTMYNGGAMDQDTMVQDQAAHEMYMTPYEYGTTGSGQLPNPGLAASMMCSYERYEIVAAPGTTAPASALGPTGGDLACDNDLKNRIPRNLWGWQGFFASDYLFAMDSTIKAIESGTDQEMPTSTFFGQPLALAVQAGQVPLATFNQALARILYQEERFHLLGHADANSNYLSPSNPTDSTGQWALSQAQKAYDASIVEKASEEGAILFKNGNNTLPLTTADLNKGVLVLGESAEYMPENPGAERSNGYYDRGAISPLEQLRQFAPAGAKITYLPYVASSGTIGDGVAVPQAVLSTDGTTIGNGLQRSAGPGSPTIDPRIDFTSVSGHGQLQFGQTYTWTGYVNVPVADSYTFQFQFSVPNITGGSAPSCTGSGAPAFSLATSSGTGQSTSSETLAAAGSTQSTISTNPTMSGYTERGLGNCQFNAGSLSAGVHQIQISWTAPASLGTDIHKLREPGSSLPSLRFGYSRTNGDLADVLAAAGSASKVIVFADAPYNGELGSAAPQASVNALDAGTNSLIPAVAQANSNTAVVLNAAVPTLLPWIGNVKSVLQMWYPGEEGGTSTARLLLGMASPGGHTVMTWPANSTDTIYTYNESTPLYPGDTTGVHNERLGTFAGTPSPTFNFSEGIYVGYRFFDREGIAPLFPFGYGQSYAKFSFSNLSATPTAGGGLNVSFDVKNTGSVAAAEVPQVYVGPAPVVPAGVQQASRSLAGFDRVTLNPGAVSHETIHVGPGSDVNGHGDRRALEYWSSPDQAWVAAAGCRTVWVGDADSLANLALSTSGCALPGSAIPESPWVPLFALPLLGFAAALTALSRRRAVPPGRRCSR